jgi:hypothetical protein
LAQSGHHDALNQCPLLGDRLERHMCDLVCKGQLELSTAQQAFARDWIKAYHQYYEAR